MKMSEKRPENRQQNRQQNQKKYRQQNQKKYQQKYQVVRTGFLIIFGLQLILMNFIFNAVKRHMTAEWYYIYLELMALTVFFDMALIAIHMFQQRLENLRAQMEEQQFLSHMKDLHEEAWKEMRQDAKRLHDGLAAELQVAWNGVNGRKDETVPAQAAVGVLQPDLEESDPSGDWDHSICANAIVNAVLREKCSICRKQNISYTYQVQIPQMTGVSDYHLCSVFANLLDNAIEASLVLPASKRSISIQAEIRKKYLYIRVKNACIPEYAGRRRREGRGYGKEILEKIAAEYEGEMNAKLEDGIYVADLVMKVE